MEAGCLTLLGLPYRCTQTRGLKQQDLFHDIPEAGKSKVKVPADVVPVRVLFSL